MEESDKIVNIFNVHQIYYKTLYNKKDKETIFDEINYDDETSTNKSLELFYEFLLEYKENSKKGEEYITVYTEEVIEQDKYETLYGISLNGDIKYISPSIYSLYILLAENIIIKWDTEDKNKWKILEIKSPKK